MNNTDHTWSALLKAACDPEGRTSPRISGWCSWVLQTEKHNACWHAVRSCRLVVTFNIHNQRYIRLICFRIGFSRSSHTWCMNQTTKHLKWDRHSVLYIYIYNNLSHIEIRVKNVSHGHFTLVQELQTEVIALDEIHMSTNQVKQRLPWSPLLFRQRRKSLMKLVRHEPHEQAPV